jgi:hypothetical protein
MNLKIVDVSQIPGQNINFRLNGRATHMIIRQDGYYTILDCEKSATLVAKMKEKMAQDCPEAVNNWQQLFNLLDLHDPDYYGALWHLVVCEHCREQWEEVVRFILVNDYRFLIFFLRWAAQKIGKEKILLVNLRLFTEAKITLEDLVEKFTGRRLDFSGKKK